MNRHRTTLTTVGVVAGLASLLAVQYLEGSPPALASVLAGGLFGAWAHVYVRCMCSAQPLALVSCERAIAAGALLVPGVTLLASLIGPAVWVVFAVGALAWAAAVTDDGHLPATKVPGRRGRLPG